MNLNITSKIGTIVSSHVGAYVDTHNFIAQIYAVMGDATTEQRAYLPTYAKIYAVHDVMANGEYVSNFGEYLRAWRYANLPVYIHLLYCLQQNVSINRERV